MSSLPPVLVASLTNCCWDIRPLITLILAVIIARRIFPIPSTERSTRRTSYAPSLPLLLTVWAGRVTINILPDDVLLHIFLFDRVTHLVEQRDGDRVGRGLGPQCSASVPWRWDRLVHVCQRWRSVIFALPKFLDLKLVCGPGTRVELTGIWPPLPIIIRNSIDRYIPEHYDFNAAMVHHNRLHEISLYLASSQFQQLTSAMQVQLPALTHLGLNFDRYYSDPDPVLPDGFLDGSAPNLRYLALGSIAFPTLPKLLLSSTHLVHLILSNIPHSGYISPEKVVTCLSTLTSLESLHLSFRSPLSRPARAGRRPPPQTRSVLPALTRLQFRGTSEYLEDVVAWIDAPLLDSIRVSFFHQLIFNIPQLSQFMRHATMLQEFGKVHVFFNYSGVWLDTLSPIPTQPFEEGSEGSSLGISCRELDWQVSSLAQVFTSFFPSIHMVEHLYIHGLRYSAPQQQDDIENTLWLEIFHPFTSVKNLYVSEQFAPCIAPALQELGREGAADLLPALESIFLKKLEPSGPVKAIGQFVAARRLLGRQVAVSYWNED